MKRQAIRGLILLGLMAFVVSSSVRAQNTPDAVSVRDHKDGTTKTHNGVFKVSPAGFQVVSADNKVVATIVPDDIVKFSVGELPGVDRSTILSAVAKEDKRDFDGARIIYDEQRKKAGLPEKSKRYLEFKKVQMINKMVDELDAEKGWKEKADDCIKDWSTFLVADDLNVKGGWEQWPA